MHFLQLFTNRSNIRAYTCNVGQINGNIITFSGAMSLHAFIKFECNLPCLFI